MKNAISLSQVNKKLQVKYPLLELVKGEGYFYVSSNDENISLQLASLHSTSITVFKISQQTVEQWIKDVEYVINDSERFEHERQPVKFD